MFLQKRNTVSVTVQREVPVLDVPTSPVRSTSLPVPCPYICLLPLGTSYWDGSYSAVVGMAAATYDCNRDVEGSWNALDEASWIVTPLAAIGQHVTGSAEKQIIRHVQHSQEFILLHFRVGMPSIPGLDAAEGLPVVCIHVVQKVHALQSLHMNEEVHEQVAIACIQTSKHKNFLTHPCECPSHHPWVGRETEAEGKGRRR